MSAGSGAWLWGVLACDVLFRAPARICFSRLFLLLLDGGYDTGWGSRDHDLRGDGEEPKDGSKLGKHISYGCVGRRSEVGGFEGGGDCVTAVSECGKARQALCDVSDLAQGNLE